MIILPDRNIPRARFLMPVNTKEWITPSLTQQKDCFGNENCTKFKIDAKSNDGVVIWTGWFDDREDFDAFLWAIASGTLKQERALWGLPTPNWQPWMGELLSYEFATVVFLNDAPTYNSATQSTWTLKGDWNNNNNSIELIGAGGSSGLSVVGGGASVATGGGGGGYSKITNLTLTSYSITYVVGQAAAADAYGRDVGGRAGKVGMDTYFNGASFAAASVGAKGGGAGAGQGTSGGAGGAAASGIGTTKYSGGRGGNNGGGFNTAATGGGGAAGRNGNGNNGGDLGGTGSTAGGRGNLTFGGVGGSAGGGAGGNGTEWSASFGSGGGGGGVAGAPGGNANGGSGGFYGAGGGSVAITAYTGISTTWNTGPGRQGLIVITYEPVFRNGFNSPMLGM